MAASQTTSTPGPPPGPAALALLLGLVLAAGCGGPRIYQAAKVPPEFLAQGVENVHTLDLSRLASNVANSKQIGPGDLLDVTIETGYQEASEASAVRVGDDGTATVPLVGKLQLAGAEPEVAERLIAGAGVERGLYRNPTVTVDMRRKHTHRVTVIGAVEEPDVYELPSSSCSLLAALVAAGGLSEQAGTTVEIRRSEPLSTDGPALDRVTSASFQRPAAGQSRSFHVDLVEAARGENHAFPLHDGDVVMVDRRDPQPFDVIGLVSKPGRFELPVNKDLYVLDALAIAGGLSTQWADKAHLIRIVPNQKQPVVIEISIKEAKQFGQGNMRLLPGDVVSVEKTPTTITTGFFRAIAPYSVTAVIPFLK